MIFFPINVICLQINETIPGMHVNNLSKSRNIFFLWFNYSCLRCDDAVILYSSVPGEIKNSCFPKNTNV